MSQPSPDEMLLIGRFVAVFGVQGQLKMRAITDKPDHLRRHIKTVYVGQSLKPYTLGKIFMHKPGLLIVSLSGVSSRSEAEELINNDVHIREAEAAPLEEGEYYLHQLFGLKVVGADGSPIGEVREILETGANDVLIVSRRGRGDALIPMIRDVVQEIDFEQGQIVITPLEGLLD